KFDVEDNTILRGAWTTLDGNALEEAQSLETLLGTINEQRVERVTFSKAELTADHVILGALVANDVDALDVNPRAFVDHVVDGDGAGVHVRRGTGANPGEREATLGNSQRQTFNRL